MPKSEGFKEIIKEEIVTLKINWRKIGVAGNGPVYSEICYVKDSEDVLSLTNYFGDETAEVILPSGYVERVKVAEMPQ